MKQCKLKTDNLRNSLEVLLVYNATLLSMRLFFFSTSVQQSTTTRAVTTSDYCIHYTLASINQTYMTCRQTIQFDTGLTLVNLTKLIVPCPSSCCKRHIKFCFYY